MEVPFERIGLWGTASKMTLRRRAIPELLVLYITLFGDPVAGERPKNGA